jgi:ribosomal protein L12E/L44/L45/RPP1/RPP2
MKTIVMKLFFALALAGFATTASTAFAGDEKKDEKTDKKADKKKDKGKGESEAPKGGW